ncbi:unnamed protein product [Cyprideis torosa]|uniref:Uncharacterized protein n=1 Tax=Cyprideis torosa TaxID=163714 RepID=A0A7R8ZFB9_9CRUS|nr:unnamed protein product [Cyprideis torosa]CAG0878733.1 unnamed protein product [Cyprideis torosa]
MDFNSGRIVAEDNAHMRVEPASLTKMMTEYVVAAELQQGTIKPSDLVTVSEKAWRMEGSRMFIEVNKKVTVDDLIKGLVIQSGNDAAVALAEHIAGSEEGFVSLMNNFARALGMTGTNFTNSTGLPEPDHYTTAADMAILARAVIGDYPSEYRLYSVKEFTYAGIRQQNRNKLLWRDSSVDGLKTGHTESAGYCLVASAATLMTEDNRADTLFEFPCDFSIKAMGLASDDFRSLVEELVVPHLQGEKLSTVSKISSKGSYESVTISFTATSKTQLDAIYLSLTGHERLLYVL